MRIVLMTGAATVLLAFAAQASDLYAPIQRENARCGAAAGAALFHIAAGLPSQSPCCPDLAKCTQYLSTTRIQLPHVKQRT